MQASKQNPMYSVAIYHDDTKYDLTPVTLQIATSETQNQIAECVKVTLLNAKLKGGSMVYDLISGRDRVYVFADDGESNDETFRGYVWTRNRREEADNQICITCYDNLIYWQESEDRAWFPAGKSTQDVASSLASKWGATLEYSYESMTHKKLPLRGKMSDIITSDLLDLTKQNCGKPYVLRSEQDVVKIMPAGSTGSNYVIKRSVNALKAESSFTLDGIVTQVVILGKEDKQGRSKVEQTLTGDTDKYGTIQKVIVRDTNTTASDAQKEGNTILKENGKPAEEHNVDGIDVPWIRKGDKVTIDAGSISCDCYVTEIERTITTTSKKMSLTLKELEEA